MKVQHWPQSIWPCFPGGVSKRTVASVLASLRIGLIYNLYGVIAASIAFVKEFLINAHGTIAYGWEEMVNIVLVGG